MERARRTRARRIFQGIVNSRGMNLVELDLNAVSREIVNVSRMRRVGENEMAARLEFRVGSNAVLGSLSASLT